MSFFANFGRSVLGSYGGSTASSAAEDVERLCDRLASSSLVADRRDAVKALKDLAKTNRADVCARAVVPLMTALRRELSDPEICCLILDTLLCVADTSDGDEDDDGAAVAVRCAEALAKRQDNVALLMEVLEEYSFQVRWTAVKLVSALIHAKPARLQECILASPMGVSRLMDLLSDSREVIRNDGLLLLKELTAKNDQVQGIVAFESGYDRVLDIIAEEGCSDGGIVTEDCIDLLSQLLSGNTRNQALFLEGNHLSKLSPFFKLEKPEDGVWPAQKVQNLLAMLTILSCLVVPGSANLAAAQRAFASSGVLSTLCSLVFTRGLQADVLTAAIKAVADCLRGSPANQSLFASVRVGASPAVLALITSTVSEKQDLTLRLAALYCLEAFLLENRASQKHLVATMLPGASQSGVSAGALICGALVSADPVMTWCASSALSAVVVSAEQKEQLLSVHIGIGAGSAPASLLQHTAVLACSHQLSLPHRVACFSLLCCWLHSCPAAIALLVRSGSALQVLLAGLDKQRRAGSPGGGDGLDAGEQVLHGMIAFLLGICVLFENPKTVEGSIRQALLQRHNAGYVVEALNSLAESEHFVRAGQSPRPCFKEPSDLLFSHNLVLLYRRSVDDITTKIHGRSASTEHGQGSQRAASSPLPSTGPSSESQADLAAMQREHEAVILSYKELIRQQDAHLLGFKQQVDTITQERDHLRQERDSFAAELERRSIELQHRLQPVETAAQLLHSSTELASELHEMRHNVAMLQEVNGELQTRLAAESAHVAELQKKLAEAAVASKSRDDSPLTSVPTTAESSPGEARARPASVAPLSHSPSSGSPSARQPQQHSQPAQATAVSKVASDVTLGPGVARTPPDTGLSSQQAQQPTVFQHSLFSAPASSVPLLQAAPADQPVASPSAVQQPAPAVAPARQAQLYPGQSHSAGPLAGTTSSAAFVAADQFSSPAGYFQQHGGQASWTPGQMDRVASLTLDSSPEPY